MKKIIVAAAALTTTAAGAQAADLPAKAPYYKAPIAQVYNWTGLYLGANAGLGFGRSATTVISPAPSGELARLGGLGALGGVQAGYNWQFGSLFGFNNVVLGLEADIQGAGLNDDRTCGLTGGPAACTAYNQKIDWFGTVRGRVGLATGPVLSYFTGGFAYGNVKTSFSDPNIGVSETFSNTRTGWTIGSGVEAALGSNWTGKIEYLYLDLGNQSGIGVHAFDSDVRAHIFRAGVNYRIGGNSVYAAAPVANWAGFYGGLNAGGATALNRSSVTVAGSPTENFNLSPDGFIGGAQIGYNFQAGAVVYGLEADFQGSTLKDDRNCLLTCTAGSAANFDQKMQWFGTVRGRLGYSLGSTLFYATGGLAYGNVKTRVQEVAGGPTIDTTFSHTRTGYAVGGGIESPFDFLGLFGPNWTSKTEYLYVDLGRTTDAYTVGGFDHVLTTRAQEHTIRTGLNYHFNTPVVAKY
jgi:outer membrane immunogenic protein